MKTNRWIWPAMLGLWLGHSALAWADSYRGPKPLPLYTEECGSCHLAYPAQLLPKASWHRLLMGLDHHFGSNASLDPKTRQAIDTWLQAYGGEGKRARDVPPDDRITRASWFERKHRRVAKATWARPSIQSPANCAACHPDAAAGDFEDDDVSIPK
jgi:hypothetical protein